MRLSLLVAFAVLMGAAPGVLAQTPKRQSPPQKNASVFIYLSRPGKMAWTQAQAERMGMKDMNGVPLVRASALPPGFQMAPATMGHKHETLQTKNSKEAIGGLPPKS